MFTVTEGTGGNSREAPDLTSEERKKLKEKGKDIKGTITIDKAEDWLKEMRKN